MNDSMSGPFGQRDLDPADPVRRVDSLDRDSPDREQRNPEDGRGGPRVRFKPPPEDRVQISEAAWKALEEEAKKAEAELNASVQETLISQKNRPPSTSTGITLEKATPDVSHR